MRVCVSATMTSIYWILLPQKEKSRKDASKTRLMNWVKGLTNCAPSFLNQNVNTRTKLTPLRKAYIKLEKKYV
jgi:hypothetical protein